MSIGSFISRQIKFGEAAVINLAANSLNAHAAQLEENVANDAPAAAASIVAAVEKADTILGPAESALINGTINAYSAEIDAGVAELVAAGQGVISSKVPTVVSAMQQLASKLQTEALASK